MNIFLSKHHFQMSTARLQSVSECPPPPILLRKAMAVTLSNLRRIALLCMLVARSSAPEILPVTRGSWCGVTSLVVPMVLPFWCCWDMLPNPASMHWILSPCPTALFALTYHCVRYETTHWINQFSNRIVKLNWMVLSNSPRYGCTALKKMLCSFDKVCSINKLL